MRSALIILIALCLSTPSTAVEDSRVPGGVAMIPIEAGAKPMFNEKPVLTIQDDGQHFAVVGLALSLEPGTYTLDNVDANSPLRCSQRNILNNGFISKISGM